MPGKLESDRFTRLAPSIPSFIPQVRGKFMISGMQPPARAELWFALLLKFSPALMGGHR
ncbi:MAG: hypothetical protein HC772_17545 [Leptolyngbyaceae cyanobacterium CRU_2_3]|nr:hypothetical protein [Leptolyngbyaceae cyanobacterium CRU_2_3]